MPLTRNPRSIDPIRLIPIYRAKTGLRTTVHTAVMAGIVVTGPAIRKAMAAPGCIP